MADSIFIGASKDGTRQDLVLKRSNRHGLIAGATGTGKTVTLQGIVEGFSREGVPCFVADLKGDLSGLAMAGSSQSKTHDIFAARAAAKRAGRPQVLLLVQRARGPARFLPVKLKG